MGNLEEGGDVAANATDGAVDSSPRFRIRKILCIKEGEGSTSVLATGSKGRMRTGLGERLLDDYFFLGLRFRDFRGTV